MGSVGLPFVDGRPNAAARDAPESSVTIDTNLYSRQIGAFGLETMGKLIRMNILLSGLGGAGVETGTYNFCCFAYIVRRFVFILEQLKI